MTPQNVAAPWSKVLEGQRFDGYILGAYRGGGEFGLVFEATHEVTQEVVAVKVLRPGSNTEAMSDFDNEIKILQMLRKSSGVVRLLGDGSEEIPMAVSGTRVSLPVRYMMLALASGSLDQLTADPDRRASISWSERLLIWRSAVKALMQLHRLGIVHRDLKSDNCLLEVDGDSVSVRLGDFGRSRDLNVPASADEISYIQGRGDLRFAPPEALFFQAGAASQDFVAADYYGLGSLLVELGTGHSMTSLAVGDLGRAIREGQDNFRAGVTRDLGAHLGRFDFATSEILETFPTGVRSDARVLIGQLCHPDPLKRMQGSPFRADRNFREPLEWVLRRADIMARRSKLDQVHASYRERISA